MDDKNIKFILAYDGTHYHGWQRQRNEITIQGVIEERLQIMTGEPVNLVSSGRTDAGVHALNQVCNFMTRSTIPLKSIQKGLNSLLPDDIFVKEAEYVPTEFHSRHSAKSKIYEYRILNREAPDVFRRSFQWHIRPALDIKEMGVCVSLLKGTHDFSSFKSTGSGTTDPVRSVLLAEINGSESGVVRIVIEADGFLRHMVRNIVGTVVEAGLGKINPKRFKEVIALRNRQLAGVKAPPQGLFLVKVRY
ncbi:MAG TPA: tRNA pseudouridine(38-40) synthase TruA [Deltaproteobacteria bacterium]|nr:tRNA pseudouridine(38-40) synthase TruA [Deltaproteobacteria bacterium]